jgi:UDP-N-acetylglucosamine--N-acetylmuramyl-(pentapeptide) pyrophosphoryl-undecaprenol N-acetylglucosamine transferase
VLIPFPAATDNHQFHNARAFEQTGAARLLEQKSATPEALAQLVVELIKVSASREKVQAALSQWHATHAAEQIAETMLAAVRRERERSRNSHAESGKCSCGHDHDARITARVETA